MTASILLLLLLLVVVVGASMPMDDHTTDMDDDDDYSDPLTCYECDSDENEACMKSEPPDKTCIADKYCYNLYHYCVTKDGYSSTAVCTSSLLGSIDCSTRWTMLHYFVARQHEKHADRDIVRRPSVCPSVKRWYCV